jgi:hypothetical protein
MRRIRRVIQYSIVDDQWNIAALRVTGFDMCDSSGFADLLFMGHRGSPMESSVCG